MCDALKAEKSAWRKLLRQHWRESCVENRQAATSAMAGKLETWLATRPGGVLWYAPLPDEPDLRALGAAQAASGRAVFLPRVVGEALELRSWSGTGADLQPGAFGIGEPDPATTRLALPGEITLVVVPGLGFDPATGIRLGRGAGYYDRLLARPDFTPLAIGVALPWQLAGPLPREPHDRPMDWLATAAGMVAITAPASGTTECG